MSAAYNVDYFRRKNWGGLFPGLPSAMSTYAKLTGVTMPRTTHEEYDEEIWVKFETQETSLSSNFDYLLTNNIIELRVGNNLGVSYDYIELHLLTTSGAVRSEVPIYPNVVYIARVSYDKVSGGTRKYQIDVFTEYGVLLQSDSYNYAWVSPTTTLDLVVGGKDGSVTTNRFKGFVYDVMLRNYGSGANEYKMLWNFKQTGSNLDKIENQLNVGINDLDIVYRGSDFWSPGAVALTNVKGAKIVNNYDRWGLKKESTLNLDVYAPELSSLKLVRGDWIRISVEDGAVKTIDYYRITESSMDRQGVRKLKCQSVDSLFKEYRLAFYDGGSSMADMQSRYFWWMEDYALSIANFLQIDNIPDRIFNIMQLGEMMTLMVTWSGGTRFWKTGGNHIAHADLGFYTKEINMWGIDSAEPGITETELANSVKISEAINAMLLTMNANYDFIETAGVNYMRIKNRNFAYSSLNLSDGFGYKNENSIRNKSVALKVSASLGVYTYPYPYSYDTGNYVADTDFYDKSFSELMNVDIYSFPSRFWLCYLDGAEIKVIGDSLSERNNFINQLYRLKADEIIFNQPTEKATMPGNLAFHDNFIEYTSNISMKNPTTTIKQIKE